MFKIIAKLAQLMQHPSQQAFMLTKPITYTAIALKYLPYEWWLYGNCDTKHQLE